MPRQAHGRSVYATGPSKVRKKKPQRGKGLTALETAEKQFPEKIKIRQHRLGEAEDDSDDPKSRADTDERSAKRRKIDTSAETQDSIDEGSDLEGNHWHVGVEDDDEDSDIDSEEAFGGSDEERFAGFTFRGSAQNEKTTGKNRVSGQARQRLNLNENDGEDAENPSESDDDADELDEHELGEDAIDLATALDLNEEEEREDKERNNKSRNSQRRRNGIEDRNSIEESSSSEADTDEAGVQDAYSELSLSEDEADDEITTRLRTFVNGLTPAEKNNESDSKVHRKLTLPDNPSQFGLPAANLTAADLLQYVKDPIQRQSLKMLQAGEREEPSGYKGGIPGKLAVPLAKRQQDRLDRVAAYDKSKQTMERWVDTVKQNRRAEHLSFPLADPAKLSATNTKALQALDRNQPHSELEAKVLEIMKESGFQTDHDGAEETQESKYEELQEKKMPIEEVQARRKELRMQRELMFREEIRAKRIKKIKSKAYRRVHRKEKDKFAVQERERLTAAGILNSDEEREQNDRRRAEERMGARHRESKWAKSAKATGQTVWNEDAKAGVSEMARRDDELRKRIEGKNVRESDASNSESDTDSSYGFDEDDAKWQERLDRLESKPQGKDQSKLANMAFMQKAEATRKSQNDEELRLLQRMANREGDDSESDSQESDVGRQKYGKATNKQQKPPQVPLNRNEFEERLSEDEIGDPNEMANIETEQSLLLPSGNTALKSAAKENRTQGISVSKEKPQVQLSGKATPKPHRIESKASRSSSKAHQSELQDYTSPSESEHEPSNGLDAKDRLALEIFAGDDDEDLRKQFATEKKEAVEEEGDQVVDNTLPGWGSWTGAGINKREQRKAKGRFLSTIKGVAPEARKDAKLERVIINEKRIKKNNKYMATELPHPFESRQQYERSLRLPVGPEWSTRNHFQDSIKPRILVKQGHVIQPMARPIA